MSPDAFAKLERLLVEADNIVCEEILVTENEKQIPMILGKLAEIVGVEIARAAQAQPAKNSLPLSESDIGAS